MDRGVLEASALESAFKELQGQGPVTTPYDILKWPVVAAAVEEGAVRNRFQGSYKLTLPMMVLTSSLSIPLNTSKNMKRRRRRHDHRMGSRCF